MLACSCNPFSAALDAALADAQAANEATERARRIDSFRAEANRNPALVAEQALHERTSHLNRVLEEKRRWTEAAAESKRALVAQRREHADVVERVRTAALRVEELNDSCALLGDAVARMQTEVDRVFLAHVMTSGESASHTHSQPLHALAQPHTRSHANLHAPADARKPTASRSTALPASLAPYLLGGRSLVRSASATDARRDRHSSAASNAPAAASRSAPDEAAERDAERTLRHLCALCGVDSVAEVVAPFLATHNDTLATASAAMLQVRSFVFSRSSLSARANVNIFSQPHCPPPLSHSI